MPSARYFVFHSENHFNRYAVCILYGFQTNWSAIKLMKCIKSSSMLNWPIQSFEQFYETCFPNYTCPMHTKMDRLENAFSLLKTNEIIVQCVFERRHLSILYFVFEWSFFSGTFLKLLILNYNVIHINVENSFHSKMFSTKPVNINRNVPKKKLFQFMLSISLIRFSCAS